MMKKFDKFYIKKAVFDEYSLCLELNYSFDDEVFFTEKAYLKDERFKVRNNINKNIIEDLIFHISIAFWISYYKAFPTKDIIIEEWFFNENQKQFWTKFYRNWLWEFFFRNNISPKWLINFICQKDNKWFLASDWNLKEKAIVPIWWWKDSCVSIEKIRKTGIDFDIFSFSSKDNPIYEKTEEIANKKRLFVRREISPELFKLNEAWYYNWHVPITWIISFILTLTSYLYWYKYIIFSNEYSANFWNLLFDTIEVNHQYSKSLEFENDLRQYISSYLSTDLEYFSILRWMYEIAITKDFSELNKYFNTFSSCNRNFKINNTKSANTRWCLDCPKCAFVFACLHPYLSKNELIEIFWKDMYEDENQLTLFKELLWIEWNKPFECVWTNEEVILSMWKSYEIADKNNLPSILKLFANEILPKMKLNDFELLEKKLFANYENYIPKNFIKWN